MGVVSELCRGYEIPKMVKIRQQFPRPRIDSAEIPAVIAEKLSDDRFQGLIKQGMRVAITVGSRGISNIALITRCLVDFVRQQGGEPFIVPAMGSHGGATAEGQLQVVETYGVTEQAMGCPILSSMETVHIGDTCEGHHVRMDKNAFEADGVIVAGRVKPHTGFRGPYESGLMKMMTIGLGKQEGAEVCHETGFGKMAHLVPLFANVMLEKANILMGFAILENAYDETCMLEPLATAEIPEKEPALLIRAKELMPRILFDSVDVLVIDEIGKNYSGDGHDPNISGRFITPYADGGIKSQRMVVLDLSEESHGNGCGVGLADIITRRCRDKIDLEMTYPNVITSTVLKAANIPVTVDTDADALRLAIRTCTEGDRNNPRIVRIPNTLHIEHILISEAMLDEAAQNPNLFIEGEPELMAFDERGVLTELDGAAENHVAADEMPKLHASVEYDAEPERLDEKEVKQRSGGVRALADVGMALGMLALIILSLGLAALALGCAAGGACLAVGIEVFGYLPQMPLYAAVIYCVSLAALCIALVIADIYAFIGLHHLVQRYSRWRKCAATGETLVTPFVEKNPRRRARAVLALKIALIVFAFTLIIGSFALFIYCGFKPFWSELGWF